LSARIVRGELGPVRRLAGILDAAPPGRLESLPDAGIPVELGPFVRAINRLLDRVGRLMNEQRRFIADAAHELRSPLTALSVQAQNLEKADNVEAMRARVAPLREGIDRARRLTEQLLSLARTHAGSARLAEVDASRIARELIVEYLPIADARGIDLGLNDPDVCMLVTEPETLRLVLRNALDNALSYTPAAGEVTLRLRTEGEDAVIEIVDSGPGIPAAERERVFEPFCRLDSDGAGEHSGLGLAIARDAAARLGGGVSLHDRPEGSGVVFRYRQRRSR
jgi:two-component system OmpR family sensor kinase